MPRARALLTCLGLVASCSWGGGLDPGDAPPTTSVVPNTTTQPADPDTVAEVMLATEEFFEAIAVDDLAAAAALATGTVTEIPAAVAGWRGDLSLNSVRFEVGAAAIGIDRAEVEVRVMLHSADFGPWDYTTLVSLVRASGWLIEWSPAVLHPGLEMGDRLEIRHQWPPRGPILAADGSNLAHDAPVHVIGVVPGWIVDRDAVTTILEEVAGIATATVVTEIERPGVQPDWFLPVGTIDVGRAADARMLAETPGIVLRDGVGRVVPGGDLAGHIIGTIGPITAEQLAAFGHPYAPSDLVGRSGLELAFEDLLAGAPDTRVVRVNKYGREVADLLSLPGRAAVAVRTTIDLAAQQVLEDALDGVDLPAAIVLIDVATGGILASAFRPLDEFDRAFLGLYPPGSSFKVVTASALLAAGLTPGSTVQCPAEVIVGGARIRNAGGRSLGTIDLQTALAESCNTTFASLAGSVLSGGALAIRARAFFGFDLGYDPGLPAGTARFPEPVDTAELGAQGIGQGRVLVTPLHQASIAAAVAGGGWIQPTVLADDTNRVRIPLEPQVHDDLVAMLRRAVSEGTGGAADVPGREVAGKTGSAEFDDSGDTHAWFIGFWNGYAIAVVVEAGGSGGGVAAPIAAEVIAALGG